MDMSAFLTATVDIGNNLATNSTETQPSKRRRLTQACDACRKKKVKCSGDKPTCNNCMRLGATCTYLPSTRKRGPRVGLVESLEKRLQQMEKLLQPLKEQGIVDDVEDKKSVKKPRLNIDNVEPKSEFSVNNNYTSNNTSNTSHNTDDQQSQSQFGQAAFINIFSQQSQIQQTIQEQIYNEDKSGNTSNEDDVSEELIFFGKSAAKPGFRNRNELFIHCNQDLPMICDSSEHNEHSPSSESSNSKDIDSIIPSVNSVIRSRNGLPPVDIVEHLAACFFRNIDIQMPMFHEATFMRHLRQNKVGPFLVFAICAVSARFSKNPSIIRKPPYLSGEPFAAIANDYMFDTFDCPSVEHVQGLVLLSVHMYGIGNGSRAWMYSGMAVRLAQELGLHKVDEETSESNSSKSSPEYTFIQKEIKRRTFWSCFLLDRFSACALGRPTLIDEDDCDVKLPCSESVWNIEHPLENPSIDEFLKVGQIKHDVRLTLANFGISACLVSVTALLGRVCQHVNRSKPYNALPTWDPNSQFTVLEKELEDWYSSLTPHYTYTREKMLQLMADGLGPAFASIHLLYYSAIVVLNRPNIAPLQNEEVASCHLEFMRASAERCSAAAKFVSSIAADISEHGCQFMCPFILYPIFATTTIHFNDIYSSDVRIAEEAKMNLSINENFLRLMGPYWAMSSKLYCIVKEIRKAQSAQSDHQKCKELTKNVFFFKRKGSEQGIPVMDPDVGPKKYWNRVDETNLDNISSIILPEQLSIPSRMYNDATFMGGDYLSNFLRSPDPLSPRALRLRKDDDNSDQNDNYLEFNYLPQDLNFNNVQAPPAFVYDGYPMIEFPLDWLPAEDRVVPLNRPAKHWTDINGNIINPVIEDTPNGSFITSATTSTGDINMNPLLI
ncbi:11125_t:CDS:2 [Funneliformis mosseae]|uniref:11125_t:CDS:1 n=1 Tax=Funneliformis mosseae TaxID=27381 RepID=A0A9N8VC95_FUNMO|nr:11125_t:CDS:2 [Funneliformis mosseae]